MYSVVQFKKLNKSTRVEAEKIDKNFVHFYLYYLLDFLTIKNHFIGKQGAFFLILQKKNLTFSVITIEKGS